MSGEVTRFDHNTAYAVREDDDGGQPELIDQPFKLTAVYHSPAWGFIRFIFSIKDKPSINTSICLQIPYDRIGSLSPAMCHRDEHAPPPHVETILGKFGGINRVTRLQCQLHSDMRAQIIVLEGFTPAEDLNSPARRAFDFALSLAAASLFSVYIPHDDRKLKEFRELADVIKQAGTQTMTSAQEKEYNRRVDVASVFGGKGVEFPLQDHGSDRTRSLTPATIESSDTTIPFGTPHYQDSPPQYEESKSRSDLTVISANNPGGDCALPEYGDVERQPNVLHASKRKHILETGCATATTSTQRPEKILRSHLADPDCSQSSLRVLLGRQDEVIKRLLVKVEVLERKVNEIEGRQDDVEEKCCVLEDRQVDNEEAIESAAIQTEELAAECERLGKQLPDICDEVEDRLECWVRDKMGDTLEEHVRKWPEENIITTPMKEHINDQVAHEIAVTKEHICKALLK